MSKVVASSGPVTPTHFLQQAIVHHCIFASVHNCSLWMHLHLNFLILAIHSAALFVNLNACLLRSVKVYAALILFILL
jgi:hypothetical protein